MAIVTLGASAKELRGKMDGVVFRQLYSQTVVSRVPDFSHRQLSTAQQAHCQRFKLAARQAQLALANPVLPGGRQNSLACRVERRRILLPAWGSS